MELTLKNFKSTLPADIIKKAEKNVVRECDEMEKGHFQAYVDDKDETYDTLIILGSKGEIISHNCDCQCLVDFCHHKTALLLFLAKEKKVASKLKIAKKADHLEILVNDTDPERIKEWLIDVFKKNKDLGLTFLHHFSSKKQEYSPEELKRLTLDAVKSVVNNRKKLEIGEVKKIVELWTVLHESVVNDFIVQMADELCFLRFHAIIEACGEVQLKLNTSSNRFGKYQESLTAKMLMPMHQIRDEEYWDKAVSYFIDHILGGALGMRIYYLAFLVELHALSNMERRQRIAKDLVTQYIKVDPGRFYNGDTYVSIIFTLVVKSELFQEYYMLFKPIRYRNEHNILLIGLLIEHGYFPMAEKYCLEQIAGNSREEYDMAYQDLLIEIYTLEKDDGKLAMVLKDTLPQTFNFNTYLFVIDYIDEEPEKVNWRTRILTRARQLASYNSDAMLFSFQLLDYEGNYKKMIGYVDSNATYQIIVRYAENMVLSDRNSFLKQITCRTDNIRENYAQIGSEELPLLFKQFLDILLKHYAKEELLLSIKDAWRASHYYSPNRFVVFMNESL